MTSRPPYNELGSERRTEQLISQLSAQVPRVRRCALHARLALGVLAGGGVSLALVALLGARADLASAAQGFAFWMKLLYCLSLAAAATGATAPLARPDTERARGLWLLGIPVLLLAGIGMGELARTPVSSWLALWQGGSWMMCPWMVLGLSVPVLVGLLGSFRRLAPGRLSLAGAVAGLSAGAWGATLYCLHCPENAAVFVLTWYTLGIVLTGVVGALAGPRLLRW